MGLTQIKSCLFDDEVQAIREIRDRVFGQEQGIDPAVDWDGQDPQALHFLAYEQQTPLAVLRLREVGPQPQLKLERLAVLPNYRRQGIGSELVHTAIAYGKAQGYAALILNAQIQSLPFYEALGFQSQGNPFEEAGIAHIKMHLTLNP